jgi:excisionase family DNA binding protein
MTSLLAIVLPRRFSAARRIREPVAGATPSSGDVIRLVEMSALRPFDSDAAPVHRLALTKAEAASCLGVSVDYFEQHVLPDLRPTRDVLIPLVALQRWLDVAPASTVEDGVLTVEEAASRVKVSRRTVMRAIKAGQLEASQLNQGRGGWRIYASAIDEWMRSRAAPGRIDIPAAGARPVPPRRALPPTRGGTSAISTDGRLTP